MLTRKRYLYNRQIHLMTKIVLDIPDEQRAAEIVQLLEREKVTYRIEPGDLVESATLYADLYDEDTESHNWVESAIKDWH